MTPEQLTRYSRQILVKEMGGIGQEKLLAATILVVGSGPMAAIALLYLAAAGIGRLRVVDWGMVTPTDPCHAPIHQGSWVGRPRSESACASMRALNPELQFEPITPTLPPDQEQILGWLTNCQLAVDGSNDRKVRLALTRSCRQLGLPLLIGGVGPEQGWVFVDWPDAAEASPCGGCLPDSSLATDFPQPVTGLVGTLLATETIKLLLGQQKPISPPSIIHHDAATGAYQVIAAIRDPACPICGSLFQATLDITADTCPMTFVKVKLALERLPSGGSLRVRLNDGEPLANVPRSVQEEGFLLQGPWQEGDAYWLIITKP